MRTPKFALPRGTTKVVVSAGTLVPVPPLPKTRRRSVGGGDSGTNLAGAAAGTAAAGAAAGAAGAAAGTGTPSTVADLAAGDGGGGGGGGGEEQGGYDGGAIPVGGAGTGAPLAGASTGDDAEREQAQLHRHWATPVSADLLPSGGEILPELSEEQQRPADDEAAAAERTLGEAEARE